MKAALLCLALNVYHEARDQPYIGQVAVAHATINRTGSSSICETVYKPHQFSWTAAPRPVREAEEWRTAVEVATKVINRQVPDPTKGATHFYDPARAKPRWVKCYTVTLKVKDHVFLKEKRNNVRQCQP